MSILRGHFISLDALEQHVIANTDSVFVHLGCYNKTPQAGWLIKNRNLFLSFEGLEVQDQGVGRFGVWLELDS